MLVKAYFNSYGIKSTISNCTNNYGPNQHPEKLIPKTILNALLNRKIPIYGEGNQVRDWIFVDDHIKALELILEKGRVGWTYLVSAENEKNNLDVVLTILHMTGKSDELLSFVRDRPGHDVRYSLDPKRIKKELHWFPVTKLELGLERTVQHYLLYKESYLTKLAQ